MKRYYPVVTYSRGTIPNAEMEESDTGPYVLASEAMAEIERLKAELSEAITAGQENWNNSSELIASQIVEIERLRGLVRLAWEEGYIAGWDSEDQNDTWNISNARKSLTTPTTTPNP